MINALRNIANLIGIEAGNIAGANVNGYKKKEGFISSSGSEVTGIGNDFHSRTDFRQGALTSTPNNTDLAIQGEGFFVLFDDKDTSSIDPNTKLSELNAKNRFDSPITSGSFDINGSTVNIDVNTDSLNDVFNKISVATGGNITGSYDPIQNEIQLTNNSGGPINFGLSPTTNFLSVAKLEKAGLQNGPNNTTYVVSSNPVGKPSKDRQLYFTRQGDFNFDENGFLVNNQGLFVASIDPKTGNLIKTDKKTFDGYGNVTDKFHFSANGILFNDSQLSKEGKQLALASFANPGGLVGEGGDLYVATQASGRVILDSPDKSGLGLIRDQSLEESNVSTADSLANLGFLQRFFPSTVAAFKVSFSLQDDLNNTIR